MNQIDLLESELNMQEEKKNLNLNDGKVHRVSISGTKENVTTYVDGTIYIEITKLNIRKPCK